LALRGAVERCDEERQGFKVVGFHDPSWLGVGRRLVPLWFWFVACRCSRCSLGCLGFEEGTPRAARGMWGRQFIQSVVCRLRGKGPRDPPRDQTRPAHTHRGKSRLGTTRHLQSRITRRFFFSSRDESAQLRRKALSPNQFCGWHSILQVCRVAQANRRHVHRQVSFPIPILFSNVAAQSKCRGRQSALWHCR
jgi:hypothetical protein